MYGSLASSRLSFLAFVASQVRSGQARRGTSRRVSETRSRHVSEIRRGSLGARVNVVVARRAVVMDNFANRLQRLQ